MLLAAAAVAVLLGAALQSATGFGFALVCAPLLVAALGAQGGITAALVLGLLVNLLTLATERRPSSVLRGEAAALTAWSLPGLAAGAVALAHAPERAIEIAVAVAVLVALGVRLRNGARRSAAPWRWSTPVAGAAAGALSTATSLSGPPLVLHLLHRRATPPQTRDTLAAVFLALGVLSLAVLAAAGALEVRAALPALAGAVVAGHLLGRRVFATLDAAAHERAIVAVLALTAVAALVAGTL